MTAWMLRIMRWPALLLVLTFVQVDSNALSRGDWQVTYQGSENENVDNEGGFGVHSIHPVTKKPLPTQIVYPGDLSRFFTTAPSAELIQISELNKTSDDEKSAIVIIPELKLRKKRTTLGQYKNSRASASSFIDKTSYQRKKGKEMLEVESQPHASYHRPSESVMNDVPVEMSFDGAGFLQFDDDSTEGDDAEILKNRNSDTLNELARNREESFQEVFNVSKSRNPGFVDFDGYDSEMFSQHTSTEDSSEHKTMPKDDIHLNKNINPNMSAFMQFYGKGEVPRTKSPYPAPETQIPHIYTESFPLTYSSLSNGWPQKKQSSFPPTQQESLLNNHRMTSDPSSVPQSFRSRIQPHDLMKIQEVSSKPSSPKLNLSRKKRSKISQNSNVYSAEARENYHYSRSDDHHDSSSGFIPITGNYNGEAIELTFPFYENPSSYSSGPPSSHSAYQTYSVPAEDRHYRSSGLDSFYHPSEARRFSYGILGSGNFEVIRGGTFPTERHRGYHGGYGDNSRMPYRGNNEYGNYGPTEIIIDGPIQGFQGFDNFPTHLINALSKHSELAVQDPRSRERRSQVETVAYST